MTDKSSIINAAPTKELFISMLIRDVTLRDAIGDLLDNSIDGALRLRPNGDYQGLRVDINLDVRKGIFSIADNCGGIPVSVARDYAFRFGRPDFDAQHTQHSVGVFGIGMKRALFKLGKKFEVESVASDSSFTMEVDVDEWKESSEGGLEKWQFHFSKFEEDLKKPYPEEKRGTKITVTELNLDVIETFKIENDIARLIEELQREHIYSIDKSLRINVNGKHLKAPQLTLLVSDVIKPAIWDGSNGNVKVRIIAGVSEEEKGIYGGWYVFCNKRLVLGPDQTKVTGWGVKSPIRIPEYHSQFYRFRGYVYLEAEDPRDLPWNTSKTNMDLDSPVYRAVFQQMITVMRTVIDFLNSIHKEKQDFDKEIINQKPLEKALKTTKLMQVNEVVVSKKVLTEEKFSFPEPAKSSTQKPKMVKVRFDISETEYELIKEYFENDDLSEVGREIFNYFFVREIKNQ